MIYSFSFSLSLSLSHMCAHVHFKYLFLFLYLSHGVCIFPVKLDELTIHSDSSLPPRPPASVSPAPSQVSLSPPTEFDLSEGSEEGKGAVLS